MLLWRFHGNEDDDDDSIYEFHGSALIYNFLYVCYSEIIQFTTSAAISNDFVFI